MAQPMENSTEAHQNSWNHHGTRQSHSCKYVCGPEGWKQGLEEVCIFNTIEKGTMWKPDSIAVPDDPQTSSKWCPNVASVVWKPGWTPLKLKPGHGGGQLARERGLSCSFPRDPLGRRGSGLRDIPWPGTGFKVIGMVTRANLLCVPSRWVGSRGDKPRAKTPEHPDLPGGGAVEAPPQQSGGVRGVRHLGEKFHRAILSWPVRPH